jgi:hypothetical protein
MSQPSPNLEPMWKYVTDQIKSKISLPAVWRAMEAARPITVHGEELILGFDAAEIHQSGLLMDHRHRNIIEQTIEAATRHRFRLRIIPGTTLDDWNMALQTEAEAQRLQQQAREQFMKEAQAGQTWEAVGEQLVRKFTNLQNRGLSSVQGRFLSEAVRTIAEAYGRLMPETPTEHDERNYSRTLERIGERTDVPAPVISYLVTERLRDGK